MAWVLQSITAHAQPFPGVKETTMRIAMVAFSGVRAFNQELMDLGLTFPGVLERSTQVARLPSLGLLTLAGMTPKEHSVDYLDVQDLDLNALPGGYDLVALSSLTAQIPLAYKLADTFRAMGSKVVLGGLHVTALPDEAAAHADAVVIGEGEPVWNDVVADAAAGCLKRFYDARKTPFHFSQSPMPAFELLDYDRYNRITIQTSRGCPHSCSFCASSILLSPKYKQKPIERVLEEIDYVCELWRRPFIELADDNSFINRKYWDKLLPELEKRRIRWFTESDISIGNDPEFLDALRRAGCKEVLIGLESDKLDELEGLETRNDWKLKQQHTYLENIERIQSAGIRVNGCFIFGIDGQTPAVFDRVYAFSEAAQLFDVQLTLLTPFPGTPLLDAFRKAGRMTHDGEWERFTLFDLNFEPRGMTREELTNGFRDLVVKMYDPDFQRRRRAGFKFERRRQKKVGGKTEPTKTNVPKKTLQLVAPNLPPIVDQHAAERSVASVPASSSRAVLDETNRNQALRKLAQLKQDIHPLREELLAHPMYRAVNSVETLRTFMEHHVFAVWDFMSIVKRLQQGLTCVTTPWRPPANPMLSRFLNDVVLTEESDVGPSGEPMSHLEIYTRAMGEIGAETSPIHALLRSLDKANVTDALTSCRGPAPAIRFSSQTFELVNHGALVEVAAVFSCGREDIIPEMFEELLGASENKLQHATHFRYYLERHIHLDAEEHGPMAEEMLLSLAGNAPALWERATRAASASLRSRLELWDAVCVAIGALPPARRQPRRKQLPVLQAHAS